MATHQLVYFTYNSDAATLEAKYSIVSALAHAASPLDVTVFTDRPVAFDGYPIRTELLSAERYAEWTGPDLFVMRAKILAMKTVIDRAAKTLFMDADTLFMAPPERVFERVGPGRSVMHADEGEVFDNQRQRGMTEWLLGYFPERKVILADGTDVALSANAHFWNAGVLGLDAADKPLIDRTLVLSDAIWAKTKWNLAEQFAFGITLGSANRLSAADDVIEHYWNRVATPGWHGGKSVRTLQNEQATRFFAANGAGGFDAMVDAYRKSPAKIYRLGRFARLRGAAIRRVRSLAGGG